MTPECQSCGSFVARASARVFTPNGVTNPRACPDCEDKVRDNGQVRGAKFSRTGGSEPSRCEPAKDPTGKAGGSDD